MELALEIGVPFESLAGQMTEREFLGWQHYARTKMLPTRRMELYLAQIAYWVARTMGGVKDRTVSDYILSATTDEEVDQGDDLESAVKVFQFDPKYRRKG